jgi:hypothetical protein
VIRNRLGKPNAGVGPSSTLVGLCSRFRCQPLLNRVLIRRGTPSRALVLGRPLTLSFSIVWKKPSMPASVAVGTVVVKLLIVGGRGCRGRVEESEAKCSLGDGPARLLRRSARSSFGWRSTRAFQAPLLNRARVLVRGFNFGTLIKVRSSLRQRRLASSALAATARVRRCFHCATAPLPPDMPSAERRNQPPK